MPSPSLTCWTNLAEEKKRKRTEEVPEVPLATGADPLPLREERGTWTVGTITTSDHHPAEAAQDQGALQGQEEEGSLRLLKRPLPLPRRALGQRRQSRQTIYSVIKSKRRVSTTTLRNFFKRKRYVVVVDSAQKRWFSEEGRMEIEKSFFSLRRTRGN